MFLQIFSYFFLLALKLVNREYTFFCVAVTAQHRQHTLTHTPLRRQDCTNMKSPEFIILFALKIINHHPHKMMLLYRYVWDNFRKKESFLFLWFCKNAIIYYNKMLSFSLVFLVYILYMKFARQQVLFLLFWYYYYYTIIYDDVLIIFRTILLIHPQGTSWDRRLFKFVISISLLCETTVSRC